MRMFRFAQLLTLFVIASCNNEVYLRDGVTDGDTFYLALNAHTNDDPVLQSWVAYSLMRSTCQLEIGGLNPARESSYGCEFTARRHLLEAWETQRAEAPGIEDEYLDSLLAVREAGYLDEYTATFFRRPHWQVPVEVDLDAFRRWRRVNLQRHAPTTRIIGWWGYADDTANDALE